MQQEELFICLLWDQFLNVFQLQMNASILVQMLQLLLVYSRLQIRHEFSFWSSPSCYYAIIKQSASCCFTGCWNFMGSLGIDVFPLYHRSDCDIFQIPFLPEPSDFLQTSAPIPLTHLCAKNSKYVICIQTASAVWNIYRIRQSSGRFLIASCVFPPSFSIYFAGNFIFAQSSPAQNYDLVLNFLHNT